MRQSGTWSSHRQRCHHEIDCSISRRLIESIKHEKRAFVSKPVTFHPPGRVITSYCFIRIGKSQSSSKAGRTLDAFSCEIKFSTNGQSFHFRLWEVDSVRATLAAYNFIHIILFVCLTLARNVSKVRQDLRLVRTSYTSSSTWDYQSFRDETSLELIT